MSPISPIFAKANVSAAMFAAVRSTTSLRSTPGNRPDMSRCRRLGCAEANAPLELHAAVHGAAEFELDETHAAMRPHSQVSQSLQPARYSASQGVRT